MGGLSKLNQGVFIHLHDFDLLGKQVDGLGVQVVDPVDRPQLGLFGADIDDVFKIFGGSDTLKLMVGMD